MTFGSRLVVSGLCVAGLRLGCLFAINAGELYYTTAITSKSFRNHSGNANGEYRTPQLQSTAGPRI